MIIRSALFLFVVIVASMTATPARAWQQRVHYRMTIDMHVESHSYDGHQLLTYTNNSPDTLRHLYYHLYYRAFRPGSMFERRNKSLVDADPMGLDTLSPDLQGDVTINSIQQGSSPLRWSINETIMLVELARPLPPGDSTTIEMRWRTRIPLQKRRGGWMNKEGIEFSMAQWYPKLVAYDRSGWHTDEYVEREFYGVFGDFDVEINIPAEYVLGGTGEVVNGADVRCGYELRYKDTLIERPASGTGMKRWRFHAENVHDFAWVADRRYVHQIVHWEDVPIHLLYHPSVSSTWKSAGSWTRILIEYFSSRFGRYAWPQFTVAQAGDGGMEYPQLIMILGRRSPFSLLSVISHELGHQWFYGMIGTNESQEAWMDEGFTNFIDDAAMRDLFRSRSNPYTGLDRIVIPWDDEPWRDVASYYSLAVTGYDEPMATYHDRFREGATSSQVYFTGEALLRQLQYVLGDSLFDHSMRNYVEKWRFRQPERRDFEAAMEEASGLRLDWYFNQWIELGLHLDYAIVDLESDEATNGYSTTIELKRLDEAVMPIDLQLTYEDGTRTLANIPIDAVQWEPIGTWKKPEVEIVLPRWPYVEREYTATFTTPKRVVRAEIDPSIRLLDLDRTNNIEETGFFNTLLGPGHYAWFRRWDLRRPIDRYSTRLRPTLWYSQADGPQLGLRADGGYTHGRYNAAAGLYYNVTSGRVDYDVSYRTPIPRYLGKLSDIAVGISSLDGLQRWSLEIGKTIPPSTYYATASDRFSLRLEHERRVGPVYPNAMAAWNDGNYNTIGIAYNRQFYPDFGPSYRLGASVETSIASRTSFSQARLTAGIVWRPWGMDLSGDLFFGASYGAVPAQRLYNAAGSTSRSMHTNVIQRLAMNARPDFAARNHLLLPTEGFLVALAGEDGPVRSARQLLNARVSIGEIHPLAWVIDWDPFWNIGIGGYAAGGWVLPDEAASIELGHLHAEIGAKLSVNLLAMLPRTWELLLDSPEPVVLTWWVPFYASSPWLEKDGLGYRWGVSVTM